MPKPKGKHSQIAGFLITELTLEIRRLKLPYFAPKECLIKGDHFSGYEPDGIILDKNLVENESLWETQSTLLYRIMIFKIDHHNKILTIINKLKAKVFEDNFAYFAEEELIALSYESNHEWVKLK